jgi:hypothetical protein
MESLAAFVAMLLAVIYGSGLIAFGLAWSRNRVIKILSRVFAFISIASGLWLGFAVMNSNSLFLGGIPVVLGLVSLFISFRRNR